jgi:kynurenine 3-monooxygenase
MPFKKFDEIKTRQDLLSFFQTHFPDSIEKIGIDLLVKDYFTNPKGSLISIKTKPYNLDGKCVLVGDAAHAMVPFYGQGMNCGFEDILVLSEFLSQKLPIAQTLDLFSQTRSKDAMAMCDLALHNYIEMRSEVLNPKFLFRKKLEAFLTRLFPKTVIPLYSMVSFSRIRYSVVVERYERQTVWFERFLMVLRGVALGGFGLGLYGVLRWRRVV